MIALTLAQLAHAVGGELLLAPGDTPDTSCRGAVDTDSRLIGPGGIFVAKPGEETDGHLFVGAAVDGGRGRRHRRATWSEASVTQIVVPDAVAALADLAREVVATRARSPATCASSGSPARTARRRPRTSSRASSRPRARRSRPRASFNNEVGAPLTMLRVTDGTRFLVSEFGASAPGEIARLAGLVEPDVGVVLMVGHGARRRLRRDRGDVRGEVRARPRPASAAGSRCSTPTTRASARWRRSRPSADAAVRWFGRGPGRRRAGGRRRGDRGRHALRRHRRTASRCRCACACSASTTS